ncbi:MAG: dihydroorotate dehydrogenase [Ruminococcaceae bacterium]|nr:dihydroorotate dehydrogenase [Oscillospiraceae bacterium]
MVNMSVNIAGVTLKNPVLTVSGTYAFGREYSEFYSPASLGAVTIKGLSGKPRMGNPTPRIAETPAGMLNSIGLQNPGVEHFIEHDLPFLKKQGATVIANIAGIDEDDYCFVAEKLNGTDVDLYEMNISCPNVKEGGIAFGTRADMAKRITSLVKQVSKKPLIVKLSPNVTDITEMASAVLEGGADALSLINTLLGMRIDLKTRRPILSRNVGGLSGPCVLPVALRMVWQVRQITDKPIIGMGGVSDGDTAVEMLLAGADAVGIGTASFANPLAPIEAVKGIEAYMEKNGFADIASLKAAFRANG